jgi:hypothetical protein
MTMRLVARRLVVVGTCVAAGHVGVVTGSPTPQSPVPAGSSAAPVPPPTAFILGHVVDARTSDPIPGATVTLSAPGSTAMPRALSGPLPTALTEAQGRFLFHSLSKGSYAITASAPGYLDGAYGASRPAAISQPFVLDDAQRVGDVQVRLWKAATMSGVVSDETGAPMASVWVSLLRRRGAGYESVAYGAWTDDRGAYEFNGLAPGEYVAVVPSRTTAMPASVMAAGSAAATSLEASGSRAMASPRAMNAAVNLRGFFVQTSGEGAWGGSNVLFGRLPWAVRSDGRIAGYPATFHPSVTDLAAATTVIVDAGDERAGIDIALRPVPLSSVSGVVTGPDGPMPNFAVHLIPEYAANQLIERSYVAAITSTTADGAFTFPVVAPGAYALKGWRHTSILVIGRDALPADTSLWSETRVVVGETGLTGVTVTLEPGAAVSGRVVFDGGAAVPPPVQVQTPLSAAFEPDWPLAFGSRLATRVSETGAFLTQGLPPGRRHPRFLNNFTTGLRGWYLESAIGQGRDLTIEPLVLDSRPVTDVVITFTDRRADLSGAVQDAVGRRNSAAAVVVFPADYVRWLEHGLSPTRARSVPASSRGSYEIQGLLAGEYLAAAVDAGVLTRWPDRAAVEAIAPFATRVTIARGEHRQLDLRTR